MSTGLVCLTLRTSQGLMHSFPHVLSLRRYKGKKTCLSTAADQPTGY